MASVAVVTVAVAVPIAVTKSKSEDDPYVFDPSKCIMNFTDCSKKIDNYTAPYCTKNNIARCHNFWSELGTHCNIECNNLSASCLYKKIDAFKDKYPAGTSWNDQNTYYKWRAMAYYGTGCAAFVFMIMFQ